jgi:hypothetical protein
MLITATSVPHRVNSAQEVNSGIHSVSFLAFLNEMGAALLKGLMTWGFA